MKLFSTGDEEFMNADASTGDLLGGGPSVLGEQGEAFAQRHLDVRGLKINDAELGAFVVRVDGLHVKMGGSESIH
jgi:hypothetical protein